MRAPTDAALDRLTHAPVVRRARQHRILRGDPSLPTATTVHRHSVFHRSSDPHARAPHLDEARTFGMHIHAELDLHRPELVWLPAVVAHAFRHLRRILSSSVVP